MNTRDESVKQSTLVDMLVESNIAAGAARSAMVSAACIVLLLLTTSCGFPRPSDVGGDASGDTGGGTAGPGSAIHVSPTGGDSNDGLTSPVKTLKHGIGLAAANTQISQIILATGTYSMSSGETFPYTVPPNVTVVGPAGGGAVLAGNRMGPGMNIEVGGLQDLDLQDFTTAITATGTASLKNLRILTSKVAVQAETAASLTVNNLDITGTAGACATGIALNGNAALTSSTFATRLTGASLLAKDHSTAILMKVDITGDPSCTNTMLNISSSGVFIFSDILIDGSGNGTGIELSSLSGSGPTQATLNNVIVRNVDIDALGVGNATVQMTGGELSYAHHTAFEVVGGKCSLTNVSIVMNSGAAFYSQDATLTMRGCTVANNAQGGDLGVRAVGDLGTLMDPGNNVFNNSGVGLLVEGGNGPRLIQAVGNTWKPVQGADPNGKYVLGTTVPGPITCDANSGNFCIQVSDESIEL